MSTNKGKSRKRAAKGKAQSADKFSDDNPGIVEHIENISPDTEGVESGVTKTNRGKVLSDDNANSEQEVGVKAGQKGKKATVKKVTKKKIQEKPEEEKITIVPPAEKESEDGSSEPTKKRQKIEEGDVDASSDKSNENQSNELKEKSKNATKMKKRPKKTDVQLLKEEEEVDKDASSDKSNDQLNELKEKSKNAAKMKKRQKKTDLQPLKEEVEEDASSDKSNNQLNELKEKSPKNATKKKQKEKKTDVQNLKEENIDEVPSTSTEKKKTPKKNQKKNETEKPKTSKRAKKAPVEPDSGDVTPDEDFEIEKPSSSKKASEPKIPKPPNRSILQLKITLQDVTPPIWRRIQVLNNDTFYNLHEYIKEAMGWMAPASRHFLAPHPKKKDANLMIVDASLEGLVYDFNKDKHLLKQQTTKLSRFLNYKGDAVLYEFSAESWLHEVKVEKVLPPPGPKAEYPKCTGGQRACPPEECGGVDGYQHLLEVYKNPKHPEYSELIGDWLADSTPGWEPEKFDKKQVFKRVKMWVYCGP